MLTIQHLALGIYVDLQEKLDAALFSESQEMSTRCGCSVKEPGQGCERGQAQYRSMQEMKDVINMPGFRHLHAHLKDDLWFEYEQRRRTYRRHIDQQQAQ